MAIRLVGPFGRAIKKTRLGKKIKSAQRTYGFGRYATKKRVPRRYSPEKFSENIRVSSRARRGSMTPRMVKRQYQARNAWRQVREGHKAARAKHVPTVVRGGVVVGVGGAYTGLAISSQRKRAKRVKARLAKKKR